MEIVFHRIKPRWGTPVASRCPLKGSDPPPPRGDVDTPGISSILMVSIKGRSVSAVECLSESFPVLFFIIPKQHREQCGCYSPLNYADPSSFLLLWPPLFIYPHCRLFVIVVVCSLLFSFFVCVFSFFSCRHTPPSPSLILVCR